MAKSLTIWADEPDLSVNHAIWLSQNVVMKLELCAKCLILQLYGLFKFWYPCQPINNNTN